MWQRVFSVLIFVGTLSTTSAFCHDSSLPVLIERNHACSFASSETCMPEVVLTAKNDTTEKKDKTSKSNSTAQRSSHSCLESCINTKYQCETSALTQTDKKLSVKGSKENNEWSRDCQNTYYKCKSACE